jgi:hypothetical protein
MGRKERGRDWAIKLKNQTMLDPKAAAGIGARGLKPKQAPRNYGVKSRSVLCLKLRRQRLIRDESSVRLLFGY